MRPIYLISKTPYEGVIHIPILTITFLAPVIDFAQYQGVILTSKQAVLALQNYTFSWENLGCICVSEATALAAREAGASNIEIGDGYGSSILDVLQRKNEREKWLYLRPKVIASEWVENARMMGFEVDEAVVYETTCNANARGCSVDKEGILIFTSPSSIECFCEFYEISPTQTIVAIGKTTKERFNATNEVHLSPDTSIASAVELAYKIAQKSSAF